MQTPQLDPKRAAQDNRQRWQHIIADFNSSGLRQIDYCKKHGLKPEQFSYYYVKWQRKNTVQEKSSFIPVKIDNDQSQENKFTLTLLNGVRLDVPSHFSVVSLEKLLILLRRVSC